MAAERYTRTNQKIYFAGLALEQLKRAEQGELSNSQSQEQANREAGLFHLYGAVLGLCQEIAGYYRLPDGEACDVFDWLKGCAQEQAPMPERAELMELLADAQTWLAKLLHAYAALSQPLNEVKKAKIDPRLAVIEVVHVEASEPLLDSATLEQWRQALKLQVLRFRESLSEC